MSGSVGSPVKNLGRQSFQDVVSHGRVYRGPRRAAFLYMAAPTSIAPEITDYFSLFNSDHIAQFVGEYALVVLPKEVVFDTGVAWTDGNPRADTSGIDYTHEAAYGPRWKTVIAKVKAQQANRPLAERTRFFGYIPVGQRHEYSPGVSDYELTATEIQAAVDEWLDPDKLDCEGVFFDQGGYDFQVRRVEEQNDSVDYIRDTWGSAAKGAVMFNAWFPAQIMGSAVVATYNPDGIAPSFGGTAQKGLGDLFTAESCPVNTDTTTAQYEDNFRIQNFRFTDASNGLQGLNERVQAMQTGREARNIGICALSFIRQGPEAEFYDNFTQALAAMWSWEYVSITRDSAFQDFHPRTWKLQPWDQILGLKGLYDDAPDVTVTTNGGGSTISGYARSFENGTLAMGIDPTLGLHWVKAPGVWWLPGMISRHANDGAMWTVPVRTVLTDSPAALDDNPDTNLGYARGAVPVRQGGRNLDVGDYALNPAGALAGLWYCYGKPKTWDPGAGSASYIFMRRLGCFYNGMQDLAGLHVRVTDGSYRGTVYELVTPDPFTIGVDALEFQPVNGEVSLFEEVTIPVGQGSGGIATEVQIPAACLIVGGSLRVTQAPGGGATALDFGISGGDTDAFADDVAVTEDSTADSIADGGAGVTWPLENASAVDMVLTTDSDVTGSDMIVRVSLRVRRFPAPAAS